MLGVIAVVQCLYSIPGAPRDRFISKAHKALQGTLTVIIATTGSFTFISQSTRFVNDNKMVLFWLVTMIHRLESSTGASTRVLVKIIVHPKEAYKSIRTI